jgi:hypothetical protein
MPVSEATPRRYRACRSDASSSGRSFPTSQVVRADRNRGRHVHLEWARHTSSWATSREVQVVMIGGEDRTTRRSPRTNDHTT